MLKPFTNVHAGQIKMDTLVLQRRMLALPPLMSLQVNPVMESFDPLLVNFP